MANQQGANVMGTSWNGFQQSLGADMAAGLTRGTTLPYQRMESFSEAELRYREERMLVEAERRQALRGKNEKSQASREGMVTRWTAWLSSVLPRRSSRESDSSSVCAN